ncbi:MAG: glycoside hydrolase family 117 protein [Thalassotalea sp.]
MKPLTQSIHLILFLFFLLFSTQNSAQEHQPFPFELPKTKPQQPLSEAINRLYEQYDAPTYRTNELFSQFRYTRLNGFDYRNGNGTISRRDPTKVIKANGQYYVWYTRRDTETPPRGAKLGTDVIPSSDWDLSEIWYATSKDGFNWQEQGVAIERPEKPNVGWRSVSTPDILVWKGKYYLYYQGFLEMSGKRGDDCPVTVSVADSPNGPWKATNKIVIPNGPEGAWDSKSIHDPYPLVHNGKIYLYYKSDFGTNRDLIRMQGVATADDPLGPFTKSPLNPVLNSGHETTLFPWKEGIAALVIRHGNEHNTIQYAPDGVNFHVETNVSMMPVAAGPYIPDAFTDTKNGKGILWGISHFAHQGTRSQRHSILARFDCELHQDKHERFMKDTEYFLDAEIYFSKGLGNSKQSRIQMGIDELKNNELKNSN